MLYQSSEKGLAVGSSIQRKLVPAFMIACLACALFALTGCVSTSSTTTATSGENEYTELVVSVPLKDGDTWEYTISPTTVADTDDDAEDDGEDGTLELTVVPVSDGEAQLVIEITSADGNTVVTETYDLEVEGNAVTETGHSSHTESSF